MIMGLMQTGLMNMAAAVAAIPIRPTAASSIAEGVDHLYFFLTAITLFFTVLIFSTIFFFMVKFRRRSADEQPADTKTHLALELSWTIIPTLITVVIFVWSSSLYFENSRPPEASTEIFVVGKQWMWHIQHPEGPREINELHVPV
jgi:cytochrome c oxidase subunit 2